MYMLSEGLDEAELDPGRSLLIAGPPMTGKSQLRLEVLARGERTPARARSSSRQKTAPNGCSRTTAR